jgi:hypothetical protein
MSTVPSDAKLGELRLDVLELDSQNPRLPAGMTWKTEKELIEFIAVTYDAIEVARSIVRFGYFPSEPLIVVEKDDGMYLVVEGNRRLVALRILAEPSLADNLDDAPEWRSIAEGAKLPDKIPVVISPNRQAVAPIIGYRHISGIEPWEPFEKARFVANLVDKEHLSFEYVSSVVGESISNVAALYRNYTIEYEAWQKYDIDTGPVVKNFGVFTRAMNSLPLRTFIGAPAPSEMSPGKKILSRSTSTTAKELFSWLFGTDEQDAVITESRDITDLGIVVESDSGLQVLRETRDLEAAFIAAGGLRDRLLKRLTNALNNLVAARIDMPAYANDEEVKSLLTKCEEALKQLAGFNEQS